ncbi:helix-turn-helix domain-containing protein [Streptomyces sp. NPDC003327]
MSDACEWCGSRLGPSTGKGRPRKYCDNGKCRQMAHRARRGNAPAAGLAAAGSTGAPAPGASAGEEVLAEILKDLQEGARELLRILPACDGEEPLKRIAQMQEQLEGLTAAAVGRARQRRVTWARISPLLGFSEETTRHRYTERYILRRVARFARSSQLPGTLTGLFASPSATASVDGSAPPGSPEPASTAATGDDIAEPPQGESSGAAYNRLAPILSMLVRTSKLSQKEVSMKIGCSASYLSRILSGERVPTWALTKKFARVCGADPAILRRVWESQKLSEKSRNATVADYGETPMPAATRLRTAVETLHLKAGRPAPQDLAVASRWALGITEVASVLEGEVLPDQNVLTVFVRILGGDIGYFSTLLAEARREAGTDDGMTSAPAAARTRPAEAWQPPSGAADEALPVSSVDRVLKTFSEVFTEQDTVQDGRARILRKIAEKKQDDELEPAALLVHKISGMRTRAAELARRAPRTTWA